MPPRPAGGRCALFILLSFNIGILRAGVRREPQYPVARLTWRFTEEGEGQESEGEAGVRDEACMNSFCWSKDSDVLETVLRAHHHPPLGVPAVQDKQYQENLFASYLGGHGTEELGHRDVRPGDQHFLSLLSLLLSRTFSPAMQWNQRTLLTAAVLSEEWIYGPYPTCLSISGAGSTHAHGNYSIWEKREDGERVSYTLSGKRVLDISWQQGCWQLREHALKSGRKNKQKQAPASAQVPPFLVRRKPNTTMVDVELAEDHLPFQDADWKHRVLYQNCGDTDMVPTNGWVSVRGRAPAPTLEACNAQHPPTSGVFAYGAGGEPRAGGSSGSSGESARGKKQDSGADGGQGLEILAFRRRTGEGVQWGLLEDNTCHPGLQKRRGWRRWVRRVTRGAGWEERAECRVGYLVLRGTADVNDVLTDLSMAKIYWLEEEGPSWGIWSTLHAEIRASIGEMRRAILQSGLKQLVLTGHSLGGSYAKEVARQLLGHRSMRGVELRVVTFGAVTVFARRHAPDCGDDEEWKRALTPWEWGRELWSHLSTGRGRCRAKGDLRMQRLSAAAVNVVHRWDLGPRFHLLPEMLRQEGSQGLVQSFTKHFTSRYGGYAARFGAYIADALSIPANFNRTMQYKREALRKYQPVGNFLMVPPGLLCGAEQLQGTSQMPGTQRRASKESKSKDGGEKPEGRPSKAELDTGWNLNLADDADLGDESLAALLADHSKYVSAMRAYTTMLQVYQSACAAEWNMTCPEAVAKFGVVDSRPLTPRQVKAFQGWKSKQASAERERKRKSMLSNPKASKQSRHAPRVQQRRFDSEFAALSYMLPEEEEEEERLEQQQQEDDGLTEEELQDIWTGPVQRETQEPCARPDHPCAVEHPPQTEEGAPTSLVDAPRSPEDFNLP